MFGARLLLIAMIPFACLTAHAEVETLSAQGQESVLAQKQPRYGKRSTSEQNREGKTVTVAAQLTGGKSYMGNGLGLNFGFFVDPDFLIQLEVSRNDGGIWWDEVRTSSVALYGKSFLSNSFYMQFGLDHTTVKAEHNYIFTTSDNKVAYGFEGSVTSAALMIGNQWQWSHFTLGCDWFGITVPLSHSVKSEFADADMDSSSKDHQKEMLEDTSVQFLRFNVGYTF
jgi:hypothetical protein